MANNLLGLPYDSVYFIFSSAPVDLLCPHQPVRIIQSFGKLDRPDYYYIFPDNLDNNISVYLLAYRHLALPGNAAGPRDFRPSFSS